MSVISTGSFPNPRANLFWPSASERLGVDFTVIRAHLTSVTKRIDRDDVEHLQSPLTSMSAAPDGASTSTSSSPDIERARVSSLPPSSPCRLPPLPTPSSSPSSSRKSRSMRVLNDDDDSLPQYEALSGEMLSVPTKIATPQTTEGYTIPPPTSQSHGKSGGGGGASHKMTVAEIVKTFGALPHSPTSSISARPASSTSSGDSLRQAGSSRTRSRVHVVEETDEGMRDSTRPRDIPESSSSASNGASTRSNTGYTYTVESTSSNQEPMLVSIEAATHDFPVEEIPQDEEMYSVQETSNDDYRRSMTPGPPSRMDGHTYDVDEEEGPDMSGYCSPGISRDSKYTEWSLDLDENWKTKDCSRGMGALPSRVILQEVHPHDQATRVALQFHPLEVDADDEKRQKRVKVKEGFDKAVFGGMEGGGDWYYCTECCAWGRAQIHGSSNDPHICLRLMAAGITDKQYIENADEDLLERGEEELNRLTSEPEPEDSSISTYDLKRTIWNDFCCHAIQEEHEHFRTHHLHCMPALAAYDITSNILQEPSAYLKTGPISITCSVIDGRPRMDVWHCCQCRLMLLNDRKPIIPGALTPEILQKLLERDPPLNSTESGEVRLGGALALIASYMEQALFGETTNSSLSSTDEKFQRYIGSDHLGRELMMRLGFTLEVDSQATPVFRPAQNLMETSGSNELLFMRRSWVELKAHLSTLPTPAWPVLLQTVFTPLDLTFVPLHTSLAADAYTMAAPVSCMVNDERKARPIRILAKNKDLRRISDKKVAGALRILGCHKSDNSELIRSAFVAQVACEPHGSSKFMDAIECLANAEGFMTAQHREEMSVILATERSRGLTTTAELEDLYKDIQVDPEIIASLEAVDDYIQADNLIRHRVTDILRARDEVISDSPVNVNATIPAFGQLQEEKENVLAILKRIAEARRSTELWKSYESLSKIHNPLRDAYKTLEIQKPSSMTEDQLEIAYAESTYNVPANRLGPIREAALSIAKHRNFDHMARVIQGHLDQVEQDKLPMPVGLHNIGNTCYLNSLLQYLYAVRPLRQAVGSVNEFQQDPTAMLVNDHKKVGGRLITTHEVERSTKFTKELAALFETLSKTQQKSIRPDQQLAYLALVTAADENQVASPAQARKTDPDKLFSEKVTESEVTLVDVSPKESDQLSLAGAQKTSLNGSPGTVLGKRTSQDRDENDAAYPTPSAQLSPTEAISTQEGDATDGASSPTSRPMVGLRSRSASAQITPTFDSVMPSKALICEKVDINLDHPELEEDQPMSTDPPMSTESPKVTSAEQSNAAEGNSGLSPATQAPPLPPRSGAMSVNASMMFGQQHDVAECMDNILFQIEASLDETKMKDSDGECKNLLKTLFYGENRQTLLPKEPTAADGPVASKVTFNNMLLAVVDEGPRDIYDGLHELYFGEEEVEVEGKMLKKREALEYLPPLLHIQLQRVQFDRESARAYKSNTFVKFEESIFMDRFVPKADTGKRERSAQIIAGIAELRSRLRKLKYTKPNTLIDTVQHLHEAVSAISVKELLPEFVVSDYSTIVKQLDEEAVRIKKEVEQIETQIQALRLELDSIWADHRSQEYELSSVFMHRGQAGFGHYWLYQRNLPDAPNDYYHFNDDQVTLIPKATVFADTTGSNANPYLLVYTRKGSNMIEVMRRPPQGASLATETTVTTVPLPMNQAVEKLSMESVSDVGNVSMYRAREDVGDCFESSSDNLGVDDMGIASGETPSSNMPADLDMDRGTAEVGGGLAAQMTDETSKVEPTGASDDPTLTSHQVVVSEKATAEETGEGGTAGESFDSDIVMAEVDSAPLRSTVQASQLVTDMA